MAIIYLDVDGVIADFEGHGVRTGVINKATGQPIWDLLSYEWWLTMPKCDGAQDFYYRLCQLGDVRFLTAQVASPVCMSAKGEWIVAFTHDRWKILDLIICPTRHKWMLAASGRILIDDREESVEEWRRKGGLAWRHDGNFDRTLAEVQDMVRGMDDIPF